MLIKKGDFLIKKIDEILLKNGIDLYGFCDYLLLKDNLLECRAKQRIPNKTKSVIVCCFPYKIFDEKPINISRYSAVCDYHSICGEMLKKVVENLKENFSDNCFEYFIDNSPIEEVKAAVLSGVGVKGKNNLLITEKYGSYVFIGEILTDLDIPTVKNNITYCINCNKCIAACPTGFLKDKKNKCLSQITQQKAELTENEKNLIIKNNTVWGCDICQEVCPLNKDKEKSNIKEFITSYRNEYKKGENIENRAFEWRGKKVIKRNYNITNE